MPDTAPEPTEVCPGCGAVLVRAGGPGPGAGVSGSCALLFEVTLGGLREQSVTDADAAAAVASADAAYDAQHPDPADPARLDTALARLGAAPSMGACPRVWRTTIADVAADLDVIDLPVLVQAWAAAVAEDWAAAGAHNR